MPRISKQPGRIEIAFDSPPEGRDAQEHFLRELGRAFDMLLEDSAVETRTATI